MAVALLVALYILATCLATTADLMLTRANAGVRLPVWWGNPPHTPMTARVLRGLAASSAILGSIGLEGHLALGWRIVLIVAVFLPGGLVVLLHNRRVAAQPLRAAGQTHT